MEPITQDTLIAAMRHLFEKAQLSARPHILVGFSGGADSSMLLDLLCVMRDQGLLQLTAAHLDHGWRENSVADAQWCQNACIKRSVPLILGHAKNFEGQVKHPGSQEAYGRLLRRFFFRQSQAVVGADVVALAHHADDQIETFLLRLMRGSSLSGLAGMRPFAPPFIRPLLEIWRQEIEQYLRERQIEWLVDETNIDVRFLRNRIRHQIVPLLRACDERFDKKLLSTMRHLYDEDQFIQTAADAAYGHVFTANHRGSITSFRALDPVLQRRVALRILCTAQVPFEPSEGLLEEIIRFIIAEPGGNHQFCKTHMLIKQGPWFWCSQSDD